MMPTSRSYRLSRLPAAFARFGLLLLALLGGAATPSATAQGDVQAPTQILRPEDHPGTPAGLNIPFYRPALVASGDWLALCAPGVYSSVGPAVSGRVLLWRHENGTWEPQQVLQSHTPAPEPGDVFGSQVVMDGRRMLVTCQQGSDAASVQAFVLSAAGDTWLPDGRLIMPGKDYAHATYGGAIALSGDLAAIGTAGGRVKGIDYMGWVDLFERKTSGWVHKVRLTDSHPLGLTTEATSFGRDLALTQDTLYINAGHQRIAVFKKTGTTWAKTRDLHLPPRDTMDGPSWMKLRGSSLFTMNFVEGAEFSIPQGLTRVPLPDSSFANSNGDIHGNTSVFVTGADEIYYFHRQASQAWAPGPVLDINDHGLEYTLQALLTPRHLFISGFPDGGDYQICVYPPPDTPDTQVHLQHTGPVATAGPGLPAPSVTVLHGGDIRHGLEVKPLVTFTATHSGTQPVTLTLGATGDTTDFTLSGTTLTLQPGQTGTVSVNFKAGPLGEKHLQLTFTRQGQGSPLASYEVIATSVLPAGPLTFTQHPQSGLYVPYQFPGLHGKVTGPGPVTYRWLRDGKPVTGATSPSLWPTTGGRYQLEATNSHGKFLSDSAYLGFIHMPLPDVFVRPGASGKCTVLLSGPGLTVQWHDANASQPLQNGDSFSGVSTPALTAKNLQDQLFVEALVTMPVEPGGEPLTASLYASLWGIPLPAITGFDAGSQFNIGQIVELNTLFTWDGPGLGSPLLTLTGLPPGLQADATGLITGRPSAIGTFPVKVTLDADGIVVTRTLPIIIRPDAPEPGIYWGSLPRSVAFPEVGVIILDANPSGTYTGTLHLGATRTSTAGTLAKTSGANTVERPLPLKVQGQPYVYWLQATDLPGAYRFLIRRAANPPGAVGTLHIGTVNLIKVRDTTLSSTVSGNYNFGLQNLSDDPDLLGHGWGTLKAAPTGVMTLTGQMPDGSAITGSGWMSPINHHLYFYQTDAATKAVLHGIVDPLSPTPAVHWERPATGKGRVYPGGISSRALYLLTSRHLAVKNTTLLPTPNMQVVISAPEGGIPSTPVTLTAQHTVQTGTGPAANPLGLKLAITPSSGLITGQFTLKHPDPANAAKTITRTLSYKGILLQDHGIGLGCFQIPQLPATPATPIHSGNIQLEPAEN